MKRLFLVLTLLLVALPAFARALNDDQVIALHNDIVARPELQQFIDGGPGDDDALLQYYNNEEVSEVCWKTVLPLSTVSENINWTLFIGRSQGERDAFRTLFMGPAAVNPAIPSIRSAFADIFSGTTGAAQRSLLLEISKRHMNRIERLLAGEPDPNLVFTLVFEGKMDLQDIAAALAAERS